MIQRSHDQVIDHLVKRLEGKHERVGANKHYFKGHHLVGEMDAYTMDHQNGKLYLHYFEVKTGDLIHARRKARQQAGNFYHAYHDKPHVVPTFIFYHPDVGFERWKR